MPKPTISIGGVITAEQATKIARILAKKWQPPVAYIEGDDLPENHFDAGFDKPSVERYIAAMREAERKKKPFIIGSHKNDLVDAAYRYGLMRELENLSNSLTVRIYQPAGCICGEQWYGQLDVFGAGVPKEYDDVVCFLDHHDEPFIYVDMDDENLLRNADIVRRIWRHKVPPLVIKD
jgi:hypothetical protein